MKKACVKCNAVLQDYWLKDGICNGCRNPDSIVTAKLMPQLDRSNKHRAEVIEIYENGAKAAVKFVSGRIECVVFRGMGPRFELGQKGMVDYVRTMAGYEWVFNPFKNNKGSV